MFVFLIFGFIQIIFEIIASFYDVTYNLLFTFIISVLIVLYCIIFKKKRSWNNLISFTEFKNLFKIKRKNFYFSKLIENGLFAIIGFVCIQHKSLSAIGFILIILTLMIESLYTMHKDPFAYFFEITEGQIRKNTQVKYSNSEKPKQQKNRA